jgi:GDP-4-dehydro-6-deoxy-D-mannose reductase
MASRSDRVRFTILCEGYRDYYFIKAYLLRHLISISTRRDSIRIETEPARLRPLDADLQVPDTAKFRAHTGWKPEISFEKTMQGLLDYWRGRVNAGNVF